MYSISQDVKQKPCWITVAQDTSVLSLSAGWTSRSSGVWSSCSSCASSLQQDRVCGRYVPISNLRSHLDGVLNSLFLCCGRENIAVLVCLFYLCFLSTEFLRSERHARVGPVHPAREFDGDQHKIETFKQLDMGWIYKFLDFCNHLSG